MCSQDSLPLTVFVMQEDICRGTTTGVNFYEGYNLLLSVHENPSVIRTEERFSFIIVRRGAVLLKSASSVFPAVAPSIICLNNNSKLDAEFSEDVLFECVFFHPEVVNSNFNYENVYYPQSESLQGTSHQDRFYILPFVEQTDDFGGVIKIGHNSMFHVLEKLNLIKKELKEQNSNMWPCRSRSYLFELLFYVTQVYQNPDRIVSTGGLISNDDDLAMRIVQYLSCNYHKQITISSLCKIFETNRTDLSSKFKKASGKTLVQYLNELRVSIACAMVRDTGLTIDEICYRSGFNDLPYFRKMFKRQTRMLPNEYRSKYSTMHS